MMHTIRQWISRALALAVIGPIAAGIGQGAVAADGSGAHTLLTVTSLGAGVVALALIGLLLLVSGLIGTLMAGRREALLAMSFVLGWVAWSSGRLGHVYLLSPTAGTGVMLAVEGLLLGVLVVAVAMLLSKDQGQDPTSSFSSVHLKKWIKDPALLASLGAALAAAGIVAWLFARSDLAGQSVGVGLLAGIAGGVAGAMVASSMHGKHTHSGTPYAPIMAGVMLCGVVMPLLGIVVPGVGKLAGLALAGDLPGYLALSPAAWVMGALIGVPVGHGWVEQSHNQVASQPASAAG